MQQRTITVVGGSGFIGRYAVQKLAAAGYTVQVICRDPEGASHLKTAGDVGQIVVTYGDLARPETLRGKFNNSWGVVNLVGVLYERGRQNFSALHAQGAERLAQMAAEAGVRSFVHISALGADKAGKSKYARTKILGERAVLSAFPRAVILRPSVVFGPEDDFFNLFARMSVCSPFLPAIGGGKTKFQPVYAGDVASAIVAALENPAADGKVFELGGPYIYTFRTLLQYVLELTGRERTILPVPFALARVLAAFAQFLPVPPLTPDQVKLLQSDNVVDPKALDFEEFGIRPTALEVIVPTYLRRFARR